MAFKKPWASYTSLFSVGQGCLTLLWITCEAKIAPCADYYDCYQINAKLRKLVCVDSLTNDVVVAGKLKWMVSRFSSLSETVILDLGLSAPKPEPTSAYEEPVPGDYGDYCSPLVSCISTLVCSDKYICLCKDNFYLSNSYICLSISLLQVNSVRVEKQTSNSISLRWAINAIGTTAVVYSIQTNNGKMSTANSTGGEITNLTAGTQYTFNIVSTLNADVFYPTRNTSVVFTASTLKVHGQVCSLSTECDVPFVCVNYVNKGVKYCLCNNTNSYAAHGGCFLSTQIQVRNPTVTSSTTDSISLRWTTNNVDMTNVTIQIQTNDGKNSPGNLYGGTMSSLTSGTRYDFLIVSSLPADAFYPSLTTDVSITAWTDSARPGPVTNVILLSENVTTGQFRYYIIFGKSEGGIKTYQMTIFNQRGELVETLEEPSVSFEAVKLKPAQTYSYCITATNGAGARSAETNGTFSTASLETPQSPVAVYAGLGVGVGVSALGLITAVVVFVIKCKRRTHTPNDPNRLKSRENVYNSCDKSYQDAHPYCLAVDKQVSCANIVKEGASGSVYEDVSPYSN